MGSEDTMGERGGDMGTFVDDLSFGPYDSE